MSELWEKLVATALVGTDRKSPNLSGVEGALGQLLTQFETQDINSQLLGAAGAIAVSQQAGRQAREFSGQLSSPCPEDELPLCPPKVHGILQTVVSGSYKRVLPELLTLIQSHRMRVSEQSIPILLKLGQQRSELRDRIRAVVGQRGQWLAQQNPAWSYMSGAIQGIDRDGHIDQAIATEQWETETKATRLALLQRLRAQNPNFARDLLASSWKQDKAKERGEFLHCLQIQLSETDEEFLEAALTDRSKDVRAIAADLLARLPHSQYCLRMSERLQSYVSLEHEADSVVLTVVLPDADETADGLSAVKSGQLGQRSHILKQIIGAVPLSYWEATPTDLIQAASNTEYYAALVLGWHSAIDRQQNLAWATAFLEHYQTGNHEPPGSLEPLLRLLPTDGFETFASAGLRQAFYQKKGAAWHTNLPAILQLHSSPSLEFSHLLIDLSIKELTTTLKTKTKTHSYRLRTVLHDLGDYLHPDSYADVSDRLEKLHETRRDDPRRPLLEHWLEILSFRHTMTQLFTDS